MTIVENGAAVALDALSSLRADDLRDSCADACAEGARLSALLALPGERELLAVLSHDGRHRIELVRAELADDRSYMALTPDLPQAQAFERELLEVHRIVAIGHPWPKPLRRHRALEPGAPPHPFFAVEGQGMHEVAVGPVHAGVIEPGHFRFQCYGETVRHLEIQLGYQHRGAEALLLRASPARRVVVAESIAGDTAVGHATAHASVMEALGEVEPPPAARSLRAIALELERIANHAGDLGALANDVGFLPGASYFGRIRGDFLNLLMELSGNRFGRGLVVPGGVRTGWSAAERTVVLERLERSERDLRDTAALTLGSPTVMSRFEQTGIVSRELAETLGLVGPPARASGCPRDVRRDHPLGGWRSLPVEPAVEEHGDVMARARVRWREIEGSLQLLRAALDAMPEGALAAPAPVLRPGHVAVALVEGWRGEIAHVAVTGDDGALAGYKVVDPSFHNWLGLAMAMRGNQISDFPLTNKSFNLSYAGHDL